MAFSESKKTRLVEECTYVWTLIAFDQIKGKYNVGDRKLSDSFPDSQYHNNKWYLALYPNGKESDNYISLYLCQKNPIKEKIFVKFYMCLKDSKDEVVIKRKGEHTFSILSTNYGWNEFFANKAFISRVGNGTLKIETRVMIYLGLSEESIILHRNGCTQLKFLSDLGSVLSDKKLSDFVIKVDGAEIPVHRCVLAARSPVFAAMFVHDTKEATEGYTEITDIDKHTMEIFINTLYNGSLRDNLTVQEAENLCQAADKYDIENLKLICKRYLMTKIELSSVIDILLWANSRCIQDIRRDALNYLCENLHKFPNTEEFYKLSEQACDLLPEIVVKMSEINKEKLSSDSLKFSFNASPTVTDPSEKSSQDSNHRIIAIARHNDLKVGPNPLVLGKNAK